LTRNPVRSSPPPTPPKSTRYIANPPTDKLIGHCIENFNISGDMESLAKCKGDLSKVADMRGKILDDSRNTLRALARKMDIAKQSMEASVSAASKKEHGAKMIQLDREKFSLAKNINELESSSHHLESQLARLKEELEQVDGEDAMANAMMEAEDGTLYVVLYGVILVSFNGSGNRLKLKVYRSLGIDIQEDGAGGYNKAVIRKFPGSLRSVVVTNSMFYRELGKGRRTRCQYREEVLAILLCQLFLEYHVSSASRSLFFHSFCYLGTVFVCHLVRQPELMCMVSL
jgi:kinetochore protein Spc24